MKGSGGSGFNSMGIKRKMRISFALMSIIPLLMLLNYIFPNSALHFTNSVLIFLITVTLVVFGFLIIKHIVDSVFRVSSAAKVMAGGDYNHKIPSSEKDEVGDISQALNHLTAEIRKDVDELSRLLQKVSKLEIRDPLTGLFNEKYIRQQLDEEIKRALIYQRPCGFIILEVDNFGSFHKSFGDIAVEAVLKKAASLFKDSVSSIDKVARFGDNQFAVVLPEKNKRSCQEAAEYIRKKVESAFKGEKDEHQRITISAGISENPLDGTSAKELIDKAEEALDRARNKGGNQCLFAE